MAQQAHVPKFGNWESDDNTPYTQYFDNARKGRNGGKMVNPNDPQENPDAFPEEVAAVRASPLRTAPDMEVPKPKHERHTSREDGDFRRLTDSPARHETVGRKPGADASHQRHGERLNSNDPHKRTSKMSVGSDRSIEHSPLHPHSQVKSASKGGVSSPSWERERRGSSEGSHGFAPSTPGRSKLRPVGRGDESADKGSTVPKFGDWDESNPSSADGYTHIFNKVREEKQVGAAKVPIIQTDTVYYGNGQGGGNYESSSCSCFSWCRK